MMDLFSVWIKVERGAGFGTTRWIDSIWINAGNADARKRELDVTFAAFAIPAHSSVTPMVLADGTLEQQQGKEFPGSEPL
jgi:hypothetical protein